MPSSTGTVVSRNTPRTIFSKGNSTPAAECMNRAMARSTTKGTVMTAATLVTAVSEIDSAVSPRARWVSKPELTPPGQAARIISPTAISAGMFQASAST